MLTCELSSSQVKEFIAAPMIIPAYPAHTQAVENVDKKMTFGHFPVARSLNSVV